MRGLYAVLLSSTTIRSRCLFFLADYLEALHYGLAKVAYARVMLIGPGGVGKSSLLDGLMNRTPSREANSTRLADTYWAKSTRGGEWVKITREDTIKEIVALIKIAQMKTKTEIRSGSNNIDPCIQAIIDDIIDDCLKISSHSSSNSEIDVYLRVWDCGGQPLFLSLLPAFLTERTLFMLIFDARWDLHAPCQHLTNFEGRATYERDHTTTLELLVSWMATIDATLLRKSAEATFQRYPRILPIGTHGDDADVKAKSKEQIFEPIREASVNKAFSHLVLDSSIVVDNTTAGMGPMEDPSYQNIRKIAKNFASSDLSILTPVTWVLFRQVFEEYSKNKPVVPLNIVKEIARACLIPENSIESVLEFYHELSVFLYYKNIVGLASKVITNPQWLIKQIAKILSLDKGNDVQLWMVLHNHGILVEHLYAEVLKTNIKYGIKPQDIIDLLEHFQIISRFKNLCNHQFRGLEYFAPCMLRASPLQPRLDNVPFEGVIKSSEPLHLIFTTNYLPPGFFVRIVTVMSRHPNIRINFKDKLYRDKITLHYGVPEHLLDEVLLIEKKSSICIQLRRIVKRPYESPSFMESCHQVIQILTEAYGEVIRTPSGS